jgi:DNA-binding transcriptional ArsR family regulator
MATTKANLILHPLRMRIIMTIAGKQMTAQNLAAAMPDIAQATLYRHLNKLAQGGVLAIVEERPVRGTLEKVYSLSENGAFLSLDDIAGLSKDDHMRMFNSFVAGLLGEFSRYLDSTEKPDFVADGVTYSKLLWYASNEEFMQMAHKLNEVLGPLLDNQPAAGRKRRMLTMIILPTADDESSP